MTNYFIHIIVKLEYLLNNYKNVKAGNMAKEKTEIEVIRELINKVDDFYWLLKCLQDSSFDELDVSSGHMYALFNCLARIIADIKNDLVSLDKPL